MSKTKPSVSFEFFPPKTYEQWEVLTRDTAAKLAQINPKFMTVTYGAGGSGRSWTMETVVEIMKNTGVQTAAHLTCINVYKKALLGIAQTFHDNGIKHIIALRGDVPPEDAPLEYSNKNYYHYANQLIEGLKQVGDFEISVAAYPEKHPDAPDMDTDIHNLRRKWKAGADRAITQFFFDNHVYFDFLEKTEKNGIDMPIVPGILPVMDYERMQRFAKTCQANVPDWLHEKFAGTDKADWPKIGEEILTRQCEGLIEGGVEHIHFYTLNRAEPTVRACQTCGL